MKNIDNLIDEIKNCKHCEKHLPFGANPVISVSETSKIIIIGQAPGISVHKSGVPWDDASGNKLRSWLGVDLHEFYNPNNFALMPMGFCYPGKTNSGDLPPRPECAPLWHNRILSEIGKPQLIIVIGQYAQKHYLKTNGKYTLTETVRSFQSYLPKYFPLPHPSPRNNIWMAKNMWFTESVLPVLKQKVKEIV